MKGEEAELRGKGSGRGGALWAPGHHSAPPQPPPPPSHAPALAYPQALGAAGGRHWEIRGLGGVGPRGRGRGISPHACLGLLPSPSPARCGGAALGEFHRAAMAPASLDWGGRGVVREKSGKREGTGWDQARSCLLQTPAASACPGLSVHHSRLFRGCGGREWHFHGQARGVRICEGKSVRIGKRVYACAFENEWLTGSVCVHFIQGCL